MTNEEKSALEDQGLTPELSDDELYDVNGGFSLALNIQIGGSKKKF